MSLGKDFMYIVPKLDASGKGEVERELKGIDGGPAGENIGNSLFGKLKSTLVKLGVADLVRRFLTSAIGSYADYEQYIGGIETLFGDAADQIKQYAHDAYTNAGMSANEYMSTVTSFSGALIRTLGDDRAEAARLANMAINDMADQANKYGTTLEMVRTTYMSLARGNTQTLDNLFGGMFSGTKQGLRDMLDYAEQYRASLGETVSYSEDSYADIVSAIHDVSVKLGVYGTTADEAQKTISGSLNMTKASWENLLVAFADGEQDIKIAVKQFADSLVNTVKLIAPRLGEIIAAFIASIPDILLGLMEAVGTFLIGLWGSIETSIAEFFNSIAPAIVEWINGIYDGITGFFDDIVSGLTGLWDSAVAAVSGMWNDVVNWFASGVDSAVNWVMTIPDRILAFFANAGTWLIEAGGNLVDGFIEGIKGAVDGVISAVTGFVDDAIGAAKRLLGIASPSKVFAQIGAYTMEGFEQGIEKNAQTAADSVKRAVSGITAAASVTVEGNRVSGRGDTFVFNITADSETTLQSLVKQAQRARMAYGRA